AIKIIIFILTVAGVIILIFDNYNHMRFVSFYDVYTLRFESRDSSSGGISGYLIMWLSICFIPYYTTIGLLEKNRISLFFSFLLSLLVYMANGSKSTLLMPFVIIMMNLLINKKGDFIIKLLMIMNIIIVFLMFINIPYNEMIRAIFFMRTLATPGWTLTTYYEYFLEHGLTFYTHIGFINFFSDSYPYGKYSLGQMIGKYYSGSYDANFNANFWASDGIAALGPWGIPLITMFVLPTIWIINQVSYKINPKFTALWLTGFWFTLMNVSLTTSLLSGGGLLVIMALFFSNMLKYINRH
uniref:hypothetical protein n=1 Tax=Xenorhabdus sp. PB30.3 TaxID=2788941 RepID=UPI001E64FA9C